MNRGQFQPRWANPSKTKTYRAWNNAVSRCHNPKDKSFPDYGGRGISVCERWKNNYDNFVSDMGIAPPGLSLERMDVDGDYDPFNCLWATRKQQANNTRKNFNVDWNGKIQTATQWAEELGIPPARLIARLHRMPVERAMTMGSLVPSSPHGGHARYATHGCRCEICVTEHRKRANLNYRRKNPIAKYRRKPIIEYDL